MLNASYSWRGNNIIRKRIPCINDTVTKKIVNNSRRFTGTAWADRQKQHVVNDYCQQGAGEGAGERERQSQTVLPST